MDLYSWTKRTHAGLDKNGYHNFSEEVSQYKMSSWGYGYNTVVGVPVSIQNWIFV